MICKHTSIEKENGELEDRVFDKIAQLKTGYCVVFAATGLMTSMPEDDDVPVIDGALHPASQISKIGRRYLVVGVRKRITLDAGRSVLAVS